MILTPDSTGSVSSGASLGSVEAMGGPPSTPNRRPTAVYPNTRSSAKTLKPFSRSAAKRESVLALGSIEHLQHYFTKTGLVTNRDPLEKPHYGLVPAIGGAAYLPSLVVSSSTSSAVSISSSPSSTSTALSPDSVTVTCPPSSSSSSSSSYPRKPSFPPNLPKTYETDPDSLLPGVADDLNAVARAWNLDTDAELSSYSLNNTNLNTNPSGEPIVTVTSDTKVDILELLKTTTKAIRSSRNYLVSLPDELALSPIHSRAHFRPSVLGPGQAIRPRSKHANSHHQARHGDGVSSSSTSSTLTLTTTSTSFSSPLSSSKNLLPNGTTERHARPGVEKRAPEDPSALVRGSALEVLAVLREVEERYRLPLSDEAYDAQSDGGSGGGHSRGPTMRTTSPDPILSSDHELDSRHHDHDGDLSITYSLIQIQVGDRLEEVPVWEDEERDSDLEEKEKEKRELWDERLVLGSGWLYRQDVRMEELQKEKEVVRGYLDVVDRIIFGGGGLGSRDGEPPGVEDELLVKRRERGWEREKRKMMRSRSKGRRVSAGDGEGRSFSLATVMERSRDGNRRVSAGVVELLNGMRLTEEPEDMHLGGEGGMGSIPKGTGDGEKKDGEESVDEEDLPEWASRGKFVDDDLGRAHAFLTALLPSHLLPMLGPACDFLSSLSSGQLLCAAYNMCVRKSKKPWGYVSKDSIHDIVALEKAQAEVETEGGEGKKKGWTFRRTDNLRLWIGALKLRYLLPIQTPNQPLNQSSLNSLQLLGHLQASSGGGGLGLGGGTGMNISSRTPIPSPTKMRFTSATEPVIEFDARVVARKDEGWEDMLEKVLVRWMWKAVEEKRSFR